MDGPPAMIPRCLSNQRRPQVCDASYVAYRKINFHVPRVVSFCFFPSEVLLKHLTRLAYPRKSRMVRGSFTLLAGPLLGDFGEDF